MQAVSECPVMLQNPHRAFRVGHFPSCVVCFSNPHCLHLLFCLGCFLFHSRDPEQSWLLFLCGCLCCFLLNVFSSMFTVPCWLAVCSWELLLAIAMKPLTVASYSLYYGNVSFVLFLCSPFFNIIIVCYLSEYPFWWMFWCCLSETYNHLLVLTITDPILWCSPSLFGRSCQKILL